MPDIQGEGTGIIYDQIVVSGDRNVPGEGWVFLKRLTLIDNHNQSWTIHFSDDGGLIITAGDPVSVRPLGESRLLLTSPKSV